MKISSTLLAVLTVLCVTSVVSGQCTAGSSSLTTPLAGGNGQSGYMFDVLCTDLNNVSIEAFAVTGFTAGTTVDVEIYSKDGSWVGSENNAAAWGAPIASYTGLAVVTANTPIYLPPLPVPEVIVNGCSRAYYIVSNNGGILAYTNGVQAGNVWASDASLTIFEGIGSVYAFGAVFNPRNFNGVICYNSGAVAPPPSWQTNHANASVSIDGVVGGCSGPAIVNKLVVNCPGAVSPATGALDIATQNTATAPMDIVIAGGGAVATGIDIVQILAPGTVGETGLVNLNVASLQTSFFGGAPLNPQFLVGPGFPSGVGLNMSIAWSTTTPGSSTYQGVFFGDPTSAVGVRLSQACELNITSGAPTTAPGPTLDDQVLSYDVTGGATCWVSGIDFYGTSYTSIHVDSNGRVGFESYPSNWAPTVAGAISGPPEVMVWTDLSPNLSGSITLSQGTTGGAGGVKVEWSGVPYFSGLGASSFSIEFEETVAGSNADVVQLVNLQGIDQASPPSDAFMIGISPGSPIGQPAATDPFGGIGMVFEALCVTSPVASPTDMIYDYAGLGLFPASLTTSPGTCGPPALLQGITFLPDGAGNYLAIGN